LIHHPLLTIITSNLNSGKQLHKTLSALQKYKPSSVEYIVIDGGSTDSSFDTIGNFSEVIDSFVCEPDRGIYDAWNKGVALATGSYICFLGAGDFFEDGALSDILGCVARNPTLDFVSGRAMIVDDYNLPIRLVGRPWEWKTFRRHSVVAHPGSLHSRRLFDKYGLYNADYRIAGDYEFLLRSGKYLQAKFLDRTIVRMLEGGISQTSNSGPREELDAKIKNHAVPSLVAYIDLCVALIKQWGRHKVALLFTRNFSK
jgi:glycosyltransferase involved in cell wall biosynthesis